MVIEFILKNSKLFTNITYSWFQNSANLWMLYSFSCVIP